MFCHAFELLSEVPQLVSIFLVEKANKCPLEVGVQTSYGLKWIYIEIFHLRLTVLNTGLKTLGVSVGTMVI